MPSAGSKVSLKNLLRGVVYVSAGLARSSVCHGKKQLRATVSRKLHDEPSVCGSVSSLPRLCLKIVSPVSLIASEVANSMTRPRLFIGRMIGCKTSDCGCFWGQCFCLLSMTNEEECRWVQPPHGKRGVLLPLPALSKWGGKR